MQQAHNHLIRLCVSISVVVAVVQGQNPFPSDQNKHFFPENVDDNTLSCHVPPYQNISDYFTPQDGMCGNSASVGDLMQDPDAIFALAVAYAPYLYFHPLEQFTMSAVNRTFDDPSQGEIYLDFGDYSLMSDELDPTLMMQSTRDRDPALISHKFFFEYDTNLTNFEYPNGTGTYTPDADADDSGDGDYKFGDGFDPDTGISKAPIYYNVFDSGNGTITFNYFFYFTYNGANSFGVLSSYNGTEQYVRMVIFPWGAHEGDWESLSVTVCGAANTSQPLAVTYRQGERGQIHDCTKGDCTFHKDSETNPVGFVALNTHDVYGVSVKDLVYDEAWPLEFWINLQGFLFVHRTAYADPSGRTRYFAPNSGNVVRLAEQQDIPDNVHPSEYWGAFGGQWGRPAAIRSTRISSQEFPFCIDNTTVNGTIPCPTADENPIFDLVLQLLSVISPQSAIVEAASLLIDYLLENSLGEPPFGPAAHAHYQHLGLPRNAPIWQRILDPSSDTGESYCQRLLVIPDTSILPPNEDVLPVDKTIIGIITMCACFAFATFVYFLTWSRFITVHPVFRKDEEGRYIHLGRDDWLWLFHMAFVYSAAYVVAWVGLVLFYIGFDRLLELLEKFFGTDFSIVVNLFVIMGSIVIAVDTLLLIAMWLRTEDIWQTMNETFTQIVVGKQSVSSASKQTGGVFSGRQVRFNSKRIRKWYAVMVAITLLSLVFATLMAVEGVFNVGMAYAIGEICRDVIGSLEGICFRFNAFSMKEIKCGEDFHHFCNEWAQQEMILTLWGAFIVVISHFFLIASAGGSIVHLHSVRREIQLLPNHEEYQASFLGIADSTSVVVDAESNQTRASAIVEEEKQRPLFEQAELDNNFSPAEGDNNDTQEGEEESAAEPTTAAADHDA